MLYSYNNYIRANINDNCTSTNMEGRIRAQRQCWEGLRAHTIVLCKGSPWLFETEGEAMGPGLSRRAKIERFQIGAPKTGSRSQEKKEWRNIDYRIGP